MYRYTLPKATYLARRKVVLIFRFSGARRADQSPNIVNAPRLNLSTLDGRRGTGNKGESPAKKSKVPTVDEL